MVSVTAVYMLSNESLLTFSSAGSSKDIYLSGSPGVILEASYSGCINIGRSVLTDDEALRLGFDIFI